jgi:RNA polymerase sigma factor (sigma-70 family)
MEAARTLTSLPERIRRRKFTDACEELRPLGVAYVLRRFGPALDRADAEDVVAEVIIRFDRLDTAGRRPDRLRPAFFQSCRNAALDLLRYRGVRPTAPLEAVEEWEASGAPGPEEHAEAHENVVRLREAMARMRPNYREAIVLRFGLGLTVPEIAEQVGISLPAAKKLVLRSTAQIRERMEAIAHQSFCPEMREIAERSVIDGELAGTSDAAESAAIKAHLEHCGACRGFLASLRSSLHELGGTVLLGGIAGGKLGLVDRLASGVHVVTHGAHSMVARARLTTYRAAGVLRPEGPDSAGLLAGTGQKIAAVCTAGVAGAATCAATGIVGPGIGLAHHQPVQHHHAQAPPAHVRKAPPATHQPLVTFSEPEEAGDATETAAAPASASTADPAQPHPRGGEAPTKKVEPDPKKKTSHHTEPIPETATETVESQFGIEEEPSAAPVESAPSESPAPVAEARTVEPSTSSSSSSSSSSAEGSKISGSSSGGHDEFGFGG